MINKNATRLHVVDALRGFAIVSIMLLHNIEHFDVYFQPQDLPSRMVTLDQTIWDSLFFLFGGKSYAIFALLFGLTFFIQTDHQEQKGKDFRWRFAWRLVLLFGFGLINSVFYQGDILTLYALVGFLLIPFAKMKSKWVFFSAILLLLLPTEWVKLIQGINNPDLSLENPVSWTYFGKMNDYILDGSFLHTARGNLTNGKMAVLHWSWENGRFFHILALFCFGMLAGRKKLFAWNTQNKKIWIGMFTISILVFIPLYILKNNLPHLITSEVIKRPLETIETAFTNISFMLVLVAGFVLLFQTKYGNKVLNVFSPIGKMSLSNYLFQSMIGSSIYYGFGLGLYKFTGATYSVIIGIALAILLGIFCTQWAKKFKHGPLETIWHKLTWINSK
ncbi:DUF418 domain-containing protein [Plebeiibacterium sediminum]|uniref:DUF418 domain-containing protein n=1 Tax=Plebeiibacterium sediminum TaxID=2992112 RepID=A0AAE3SFN5_9BACT|nr:DUF418 domain-containing protein [Plebeiobacterium sediminum]MCW3786378.1 DUF418 domain-containing protein [Plebeiobacterium sediminum]